MLKIVQASIIQTMNEFRDNYRQKAEEIAAASRRAAEAQRARAVPPGLSEHEKKAIEVRSAQAALTKWVRATILPEAVSLMANFLNESNKGNRWSMSEVDGYNLIRHYKLYESEPGSWSNTYHDSPTRFDGYLLQRLSRSNDKKGLFSTSTQITENVFVGLAEVVGKAQNPRSEPICTDKIQVGYSEKSDGRRDASDLIENTTSVLKTEMYTIRLFEMNINEYHNLENLNRHIWGMADKNSDIYKIARNQAIKYLAEFAAEKIPHR